MAPKKRSRVAAVEPQAMPDGATDAHGNEHARVGTCQRLWLEPQRLEPKTDGLQPYADGLEPIELEPNVIACGV